MDTTFFVPLWNIWGAILGIPLHTQNLDAGIKWRGVNMVHFMLNGDLFQTQHTIKRAWVLTSISSSHVVSVCFTELVSWLRFQSEVPAAWNWRMAKYINTAGRSIVRVEKMYDFTSVLDEFRKIWVSEIIFMVVFMQRWDLTINLGAALLNTVSTELIMGRYR